MFTAIATLVTMAAAPLPELIVSPAWLKERLAASGERLVVIEASWTPASQAATDYHAGHIPGAIHLNTDELENGYPRWRLRPVAELHNVIGGLGIGPDTAVVVYSRQSIAAARIWWVLYFAGVRDVRLLNGGYAAWRRAGHQGETVTNTPVPTQFHADVRSEALASTAYVRNRLGQRSAVLADVRSREEFLGDKSGYEYLDRKGRVPGAVYGENADDAAEVYQHRDGTLRSFDEIRRLWRPRGLLNGGEVIFYCGSGWRSSLAYLYAVSMGLARVRNYSDGWSGWSTVYEPVPGHVGSTPGWRQTATANPVESGPPAVTRPQVRPDSPEGSRRPPQAPPAR